MANSRESRLQPIVNYTLTAVAVALVLTVLGAWIATSRPVSTINKDSLQKMVESLHSYAAESSIVASQYKNHHATNNFTEVSATKLHDAVSSLSDQLEEQKIDPSVKEQVKDVTKQATDLGDALSELIQLPGDKQASQILQQINDIKQESEAS
jgi:DNA-binding ferritin-like protein